MAILQILTMLTGFRLPIEVVDSHCFSPHLPIAPPPLLLLSHPPSHHPPTSNLLHLPRWVCPLLPFCYQLYVQLHSPLLLLVVAVVIAVIILLLLQRLLLITT
jgi:hypothetical protein